ncbi:MAG: iron ABC transporter permease [Chlorobiales bacterium]|nr:iron ABC transporter permease [Chlorobiales bacterium]
MRSTVMQGLNTIPAVRIVLFLVAVPLLLGLSLLLGPTGVMLPDFNEPVGKAIMALRFNRLVMGLLVGSALSVSGVVFQAILRNPLAEPYVLGVSGGAGLGATMAILFGAVAAVPLSLPLTAFVSAVATLFLVYGIASKGSGGVPSVYSLILSGVIISAICSSLIMFFVSMASVEGLHNVVWWMLGNLQPVPGGQRLVSVLFIASGIGGAWLLSSRLNALTLGREMAHYQGINADVVIMVGLLCATLMAATAVSMAGMIGFVGLIVPHVARAMFGPDHRWLVPLSAIGGGTFLAVCDAFARTVLAPIEVPVGVVTALAGGPFFLLILQRKMKSTWIG